VDYTQNLPVGTVTFLFTDIEGSTRMLRELGRARYKEVLARHSARRTSAAARTAGRRR
jgi:class 3 adenylate cyclase